jgi:hypothetical protein
MVTLRWWAVWFLSKLGDSSTQAILVAEAVLADMEGPLGPDHPDTLASRNNLAVAYVDAGRTAEAIPPPAGLVTGECTHTWRSGIGGQAVYDLGDRLADDRVELLKRTAGSLPDLEGVGGHVAKP